MLDKRCSTVPPCAALRWSIRAASCVRSVRQESDRRRASEIVLVQQERRGAVMTLSMTVLHAGGRPPRIVKNVRCSRLPRIE